MFFPSGKILLICVSLYVMLSITIGVGFESLHLINRFGAALSAIGALLVG